MANNNVNAEVKHPDLSDPGIASELADEAVADAKEVVNEAAERIKDGAANAADQIERSARAAYEHPTAYAEFSLRSFKRYARAKPIEAIVVAAGFAFAFGALWGIARR